MRLICGIIRLDGAAADPQIAAAMAAAMSADGLSPRLTVQAEATAALAVLDFAAPAEPGADALPQGPDGTWLAADLRLDRPAELAAALGCSAFASTDELALAALARWDMDAPDRLDGDFALAQWHPGRRRLVLARDIMGARPLCWTHQPGRHVAFASLPRGLYGSGAVERRVDPVALGRLLFEPALGHDVTGMQNINWLPPGHALAATPDGVRLHRAWRPDPARVGVWRGSAAEAAEQMRALVEAAVACRLPSAGPVAAHLSGGLDSSAVAVLAARHLRADGRRLHVFSQMADPTRASDLRDERNFIHAVLSQEPGMAWTPAHVDGFETGNAPELGVDGPLVSVDEAICAAAAQAGAGMLLTGAGGDETATFNGADLYAAMLRQGRWRELPAELRARARRDGQPLSAVILRRVVGPLLPHWLRQTRRRLLGITPPRALLASLEFLHPDLAPRVAAAMQREAPRVDTADGRIRMLSHPYLAGRATRWAAIGARHGIAFSHPLLDRRIIDFTLSLPLERFAQDGHTRQPFRNAMAGVLPDAVRLRDSKFMPFPDLPLVLAARKPALLAQVAALRGEPAAGSHFDLDAIAAALEAIPEGGAAEVLARDLNVRPVPPHYLRTVDAVRALTLAGHAAHLS